MTSSAEKFGRALGKAVKGAADVMNDKKPATKMYRTNIRDVPKVEGLKREDGWVDMQVQFLIDKRSAGVNNVVGWTVLKPGASHESHRHHNCDEFFIVIKGQGHIITGEGLEPSVEGDVVYSPPIAGTVSTTPRTRMSFCAGAGWAPGRLTIQAMKCIRSIINKLGRPSFWEDTGSRP